MQNFLESLKAALADRYTIEKEIGSGGMAIVYLAEDLKHRRKVAVKVLRPELAATLGPDRFLREIEIAAGLQHPHILPLYDSGHSAGFLYYVMPFVEGQSLRARLNREGALPVAEAARILRDVADALAHAHERKVVHRDIKPDNVLMSGRHAMVTDFGVAKAVSEASGRHNLTTAGVALGTPAYMAPEQAAAEPNLDHRVDVYALGAMAYELLTGHVPFDKGSAAATLAAHVTEAPRPVSEHRETIPPALSQMVMKCLEKRPADRWQRADELVPLLESLTTPSGGTTPVREFTGGPRKRSAIPLTVGAVVAIGLAVAAAVWAGRRVDGPVRIAVLTGETRGKPQDEFFADGVTDAVRTELRKIPGLFVLGGQTSMHYKASKLSAKELGRALSVNHILTVTTQWDGETSESSRLLVSPELVRVADEASVWAEPYPAAYRDIFTVQSEIARKAANAIGKALMASSVPAATPERLEAHTLYLMGMQELRKFTAIGYKTAGDYMRRAVARDPTYPEAWAALADAVARLQDDPDEARSAGQKALELDSTNARAYQALGLLAWVLDYDFVAAETNFRRAYALDSMSITVVSPFSIFLSAMGKYDEALRVGRRAAEIDGLWARDVPLYALFGKRQYEEVVTEARTALALDPDDTPAGLRGSLGDALLLLNRFDQAIQVYDTLRVKDGLSLWLFGFAYARAGQEQRARETLPDALQAIRDATSRSKRVSAYIAAAATYAGLNRPDSAFLLLEKALPLRGRWLTEIRWRVDFAPLWSDPRFPQLVRKIGLPN